MTHLTLKLKDLYSDLVYERKFYPPRSKTRCFRAETHSKHFFMTCDGVQIYILDKRYCSSYFIPFMIYGISYSISLSKVESKYHFIYSVKIKPLYFYCLQAAEISQHKTLKKKSVQEFKLIVV